MLGPRRQFSALPSNAVHRAPMLYVTPGSRCRTSRLRARAAQQASQVQEHTASGQQAAEHGGTPHNSIADVSRLPAGNADYATVLEHSKVGPFQLGFAPA